jgi:hypothetical protein
MERECVLEEHLNGNLNGNRERSLGKAARAPLPARPPSPKARMIFVAAVGRGALASTPQ